MTQPVQLAVTYIYILHFVKTYCAQSSVKKLIFYLTLQLRLYCEHDFFLSYRIYKKLKLNKFLKYLIKNIILYNF